MKYISAICFALFIFPLVGKFAFPILISNWVINWVMFGVFSILLPIAYAHSHVQRKKSFQLNEFLLLFCISVGLHAFSSQALITADNLLNSAVYERFSYAQLFEKTYVDNAEEDNQTFAQFIYWKDGISVQYKLNSGEYALYEPTSDDIRKYQENVDVNKSKQALNTFNTEQSKIAMFFTIFQIVTFIFVSQLSLYWLRRKANKQINPTPKSGAAD
ncbi:hypothetical protein [Alteromonas sp. a30]|uniref:hypothetical protein n=1 Tax=Alteromonas sp. a30 TaxID=2730917 RepID=UPI0022801198|nr:hypothetical protein [Alteromonas sp. a30]MCY7297565.1 hypothetical protein [Alteromonas sp. a30]